MTLIVVRWAPLASITWLKLKILAGYVGILCVIIWRWKFIFIKSELLFFEENFLRTELLLNHLCLNTFILNWVEQIFKPKTRRKNISFLVHKNIYENKFYGHKITSHSLKSETKHGCYFTTKKKKNMHVI